MTEQVMADESKGERTRRRLLEVAVERFGARGYRATSVSEIAREVGVTQAAAYAYFQNKEALFVAAVDHDAADAIARARIQAASAPAAQLVPMLLLALVTELDGHPLAKRVIGGQEPEALARLVDLPALATLARFIAERVKEGQADGSVRRDLDADLFGDGAETLLLTLLMGVVQVGASTVTRRQLGVLAIFDAVLRPPAT